MSKTFDTWTWKSGLVTWTFSVPGQPHEDAKANLQRSTTAVLELVEPFARVSHVEVVTYERGDDAFKFGRDDLRRIGEAFSSQETVRRVIVMLDLAVNDGTETWLAGAASIYLDRPSADEDVPEGAIEAWISLDVDIYASVTWGKSRDNAQLARLNGPRLSAFLQRFRDRLHARLVEIDSGDYKDQVSADGFM
jgi:hypothetical protein